MKHISIERLCDLLSILELEMGAICANILSLKLLFMKLQWQTDFSFIYLQYLHDSFPRAMITLSSFAVF